MGKKPKDEKAKVPGWMVSFGDMMTLILTFFILLVSMSKERQVGLVAKGVGSFMVRLNSLGLDGTLDGQQEREIFDEVRARFNLPPEDDPERQVDDVDAATVEQLDAESLERMPAADVLLQPGIALFPPGSTELSSEAREYLGLLAISLKPGAGQVLALEGYGDIDASFEDSYRLGLERAQAVRRFLVDSQGFPPGRVEARAWLIPTVEPSAGLAPVDARLILPNQN